MKESFYKSYEELPLFLNAEIVAKVLGVSPSSGYELMHQQDWVSIQVTSGHTSFPSKGRMPSASVMITQKRGGICSVPTATKSPLP